MKTSKINLLTRCLLIALAFITGLARSQATLAPERPQLPDYDKRSRAEPPAGRRAAAEQLQTAIPGVKVDFDAVIGAPKFVRGEQGFLSGPGGAGRGVAPASISAAPAADPHRAVKAFLNERSELFGFGAGILDSARVKREFVTPHNGLKTVVWEQQLDGIPVFEGLLVAHSSKQDELVSISSGFMPDLAGAANRGTPNFALLQASSAISGIQAVVLAAREIGEAFLLETVSAVEPQSEGATKQQRFRAPGLNDETAAQLVWLPVDGRRARLCWDVILTSRARGEMFRVLIDAATGEALLRQGLTSYISEATYRVFTSDSPSPFSPGHATPNSSQPPLAARTLVTFSALDTNASPAGWIDDGVNETRGNNADAHTDRNNNNLPDLPRPQGSPFRVFDFPMDLSQAPATYTNAAVTQLFYWNNWMHDRLYELGFTEAAGNFQNNNFGRGGAGNDAVQADAQDGGGFNNANFSTPPDGSPGRMQMYIFPGPLPDRDGDLDAEVILHEYTHGLSNRRVGGGAGISALQSRGMGEGWSDFYGLALLSEAGDDVNGAYAAGGYLTFKLGGLTENYYFGIRRYPYCTDLNKNPLTFRDIDPAQDSAHPGVPRNPIVGSAANEVHNMGEVWCVTLWEARANLIQKLGWAAGNQLILQLVTDGMNLSPANPNFLQARDAILLADQVNNAGTNQNELWEAFAKRGMGGAATSPSSSSTSGLHESFDVPGRVYQLIWSPVDSPQIVDVPFPVTVTALDGLNNLATNFTGTVALSCTAANIPSGVSIAPTVSGSFSNGQWTGSITLLQSARGAALRADDGGGHVGFSSPFNAVLSNAPPAILTQPASQTKVIGKTVLFSVEPDGAPPFAYQWSFNGTNIEGAANISLILTNVQFDQAGDYAVTVTNLFGSAVSSNATLAVIPGPPCVIPPADLAGWWRGEDNALDEAGANHGTLQGSAGFGAGMVDRAFNFDGSGYVRVPSAPALKPAGPFTLEAWINYDRLTGPNGDTIVMKGPDFVVPADWGLSVSSISKLRPHVFVNGSWLYFDCNTTLNTGVWYHVAMVYDGGAIRGFVNGVQDGVLNASGAVQVSDAPMKIGSYAVAASSSEGSYFAGRIDELSLYSRALSAIEIQALYDAGESGKCQGPVPPLIVQQPESQIVSFGAPVSFTVIAVGTPPLSYQWQKNAADIAGATNSSYAIINAQTNDSGVYAVVVSNFLGSAVSSNATLIVSPPDPPAILVQPASQTVNLNASMSFTVVASGTPPLSYQWRKNLSNISGATNPVYAITGVQTNDAADYSVEVSSPYGTAISSNAALTVLIVLCAVPPADLAGWWRGEDNALDEADANHGTLQGSAGFGAGMVDRAFNFDGSGYVRVPSAPALKPAGPFTLEAWINYDRLTGPNGDMIVMKGPDFVVPADWGLSVSSISKLRPHVFVNGSWLYFDCNTTLNTGVWYHVAMVYDGGAIRGFVNGVQDGVLNASGAVQVSDAPMKIGSYAVAASSSEGSYFAGRIDELSLYSRALSAIEIQALYDAGESGKCQGPVPPLIVQQPESQIVSFGAPVSFTVIAVGTPPLSYQWQKNAADIAGATNSSYAIINAQTNDSGVYAVVVSNFLGSAVSSNATLTVIPGPPCVIPPADLAGWWRGEDNALDEAGANHGTLQGSAGFGAGMVDRAFNFDGSGYVRVPSAPALKPAGPFTLEAWINYDRLTGPNGDTIVMKGPDFVVPADWGLSVSSISKLRPHVFVNGSWLYFDCNTTLNTGVWYHVAMVYDGGAIRGFVNGVQDGVLNASGAVQVSDAPMKIGSYAVAASSSEGSYFAGRIDELSLYSRALSAIEIQALYDAGAGGKCLLPPTIISQPQSLQVLEGNAAVFNVMAVGSQPFTYQWNFNGTNLANETNVSLTLSNVQPAQAGSYAVAVSNAFGSVLSSNAILTVLFKPEIAIEPAHQRVMPDCSVLFSVAADGTAPLKYQWRKDGQPLGGQTNSSLTLLSVQTNDFGAYLVVITNAYGSVTSSVAQLSLDHPPIPSPDVVERFAAGGVRIKGSDLAANDSDADGDNLTVAGVGSTSVAGGTVEFTNNWIYYTPPPGFTNTDTFAYTISDGHCGGSAASVVMVQVKTDNNPVSKAAIENLGQGFLRLSFEGVPGLDYRIQSTGNLSPQDWQDLGTRTADGFGIFDTPTLRLRMHRRDSTVLFGRS